MSDAVGGSKPFWSDHEICMDRDGLPHYTGAQPHLMKEYRRRVLFAYGSLEGDGDTPEKEAADLSRKQKRFAMKLINCLHGEAWKAVESLTLEPEKLKKEDSYTLILDALQFLEKEGVIRKTEAFDKFFEQTTRRRGDPVDQYLRKKIQSWEELCDLDDKSSMSEDLLSYFVLKGCNLSREDRRAILLANQSAYERKGIMQSLRVSFHDLHERERSGPGNFRRPGGKMGKKGGYAVHEAEEDEEQWEEAADQAWDDDEEEDESWREEEEAMRVDDAEAQLGSDEGASGDEQIYEAYVAMNKSRSGYQEARKKLREVQKSRGFYKSGFNEDRQNLINREKTKSRCPACHRVGHWAGDPSCPKAGNSGPNRPSGKGKSKGRFVKKGKGKSAYMVSAEPVFFNLADVDEEDAELILSADHCLMVRDEVKRPAWIRMPATQSKMSDARSLCPMLVLNGSS